MFVHVLNRTLILPASLDACWEFFSDPRNLPAITPPELGLEMVGDVPHEIYEGLMISYVVRPLAGVPLSWLSEITHVDAPRYFVDDQRVGPYRVWHHEHFFTALEHGQTEVRDRIHYVLPLGPIGGAMHELVVRNELEKIFAYREAALRAKWPPSAGPARA
jgi:ligand-binding SRPBCC domain-containing protein